MKGLVLIALFTSPVVTFAQRDSSTNHRSPQYLELGIVLGDPGMLNLMVAYQYDRFGVVASAGYLGSDWRGMHVTLPCRFYQTETFSNAIGLSYENGIIDSFGNGKSTAMQINHLGLSYELKWHWFFAEFGVLLSLRRNSFNLGSWQIGYVYSFY